MYVLYIRVVIRGVFSRSPSKYRIEKTTEHIVGGFALKKNCAPPSIIDTEAETV